jgi:ABC-type microcin C transport system permease subunit YejE
MASYARIGVSLILLAAVMVAAQPASAALVAPCTGDPIPGTDERQCTLCDLFATGQNVLNFLVTISVAVAMIGVMIGGVLIMISGGSERLYQRGVTALRLALTGFIIVMLAYVIVNTIINALAGSSQPRGFPWPWNRVSCG